MYTQLRPVGGKNNRLSNVPRWCEWRSLKYSLQVLLWFYCSRISQVPIIYFRIPARFFLAFISRVAWRIKYWIYYYAKSKRRKASTSLLGYQIVCRGPGIRLSTFACLTRVHLTHIVKQEHAWRAWLHRTEQLVTMIVHLLCVALFGKQVLCSHTLSFVGIAAL